MQIIEQFPVINLLLLMTMALTIPLLRRFSFRFTTILGFVVLLGVLISAIVLLVYVNSEGAFYYYFGNYNRTIGIAFLINPFSALFTLFIIGLAILIYVYSTQDATEGIAEKEYGRYYILFFILLFSLLGIIYTNDLFNTYVFMEILSITTCSIISIKRKKENYTSAFRYVMLNEVGSLSYLFGVALLYMITGYTNIELVSGSLAMMSYVYQANIMTALGFMLVGIGIKAAIFPFHIWLPDAHSSAPSASSAILSAVVVKAYVLVLMKMLFIVFGVSILKVYSIPLVITIIGATGMIMGSIFAIAQKDVKRMLGYSSVAQIGYIVLAIGLVSMTGLKAAFFHIISHGLMKAALFLAVGAIIYHKGIRKISDFNGLGYEMPITMTVFSVAALGLIGIPLTSGFVSKFNLGLAILDANQPIFLVIIILSSILNAIYYLPIIIAAFLNRRKADTKTLIHAKVPKLMIVPIVILGVAIITLGVLPNVLIDLIEIAIPNILM